MEVDTVVAIFKKKRDLHIANTEHWYRIPCKAKIVPKAIKNKSVKYLAFYQPGVFSGNAFRIKRYAKVKDIVVVPKRELFPHEKSDEPYYKINLHEIQKLEKPILNYSHRRIIFIKTNFERLMQAEEINDLYIESYIEEKMWDKLKKERIPAERQYEVKTGLDNFFIDFAIRCKVSDVGVECDGDEFHNKAENVKYDKNRDNKLKAMNWNILRYTSDEINLRLDDSVCQIKEVVNRYGGAKDYRINNFRYLDLGDNQGRLFY